MKALLVSIKPKYVTDILNRVKTIEIRKSAPKCEQPIEVFIYCSKKPKVNENAEMNGNVVGKFILRSVEEIYVLYSQDGFCYKTETMSNTEVIEKGCVDIIKLDHYLRRGRGYAWHITDLEIFDKPRPLAYFSKPCQVVDGLDEDGNKKKFTVLKPVKKAPMSWFYIEA